MAKKARVVDDLTDKELLEELANRRHNAWLQRDSERRKKFEAARKCLKAARGLDHVEDIINVLAPTHNGRVGCSDQSLSFGSPLTCVRCYLHHITLDNYSAVSDVELKLELHELDDPEPLKD